MEEITFTFTCDSYPLSIEDISTCVDTGGMKLFLIKVSLLDMISASNTNEFFDDLQSEILGQYNNTVWFENVSATIHRKHDDDIIILALKAKVVE